MKRILCFGDSNTWGFTPGTGVRYGEDVRWPKVCAADLGAGYEIIEDGLNGRTTAFENETSPYRNGLTSLRYSLLSQYPLDMVVLFLGTNDLPSRPLWQVKRGVEELIRTCRFANPVIRTFQPVFPNGAKILLVAPMPYAPEVDTIPYASAAGKVEESRKFAEMYRVISEEQDTYYIDAGSIVQSSPVDGVHLSAENQQKLGHAMAKKIRECFE